MPELSPQDWQAMAVTLRLALAATVVLFAIGAPIAWWLARSKSRLRPVVEAIVALPLVLPPTVLGFYLLVVLGPNGPGGTMAAVFGMESLAFTFSGLVIGSVCYSLPFVVQPLRDAIGSIDQGQIEAAACMGAGPFDRLKSVVIPLSWPGIVTAAVLGFAHTVGEFGVVLMIGGSIPGETQVLSIAIFEAVEGLEYGRAHLLAGGLLVVSFVLLLFVYTVNRKGRWTIS